jgi:hypothetical protein
MTTLLILVDSWWGPKPCSSSFPVCDLSVLSIVKREIPPVFPRDTRKHTNGKVPYKSSRTIYIRPGHVPAAMCQRLSPSKNLQPRQPLPHAVQGVLTIKLHPSSTVDTTVDMHLALSEQISARPSGAMPYLVHQSAAQLRSQMQQPLSH